MSQTILAIVHQDEAPFGHFGREALNRGYELEVASFAEGRKPRRPPSRYSGLMVFGGRAQVDEEDILPWLTSEKRFISDALEAGVPTIGLCLGGQLIAELAGAQVRPTDDGKHGWVEIDVHPDASGDPIFGPLRPSFGNIAWHHYHFDLPPGGVPLAHTGKTLCAFRLGGRKVWGLQFHPEVPHATAAGWPDAMGAMGVPGVTEERLRAFGADVDRHADEHEEIGTGMCRRFLKAIES